MSVSIARIPPAPDGSKQGIDDYLAAGGDLDDLEILPFEGGWLPPKDWPVPSRQAFQGLAGEVVETIKPFTESDPIAVLAAFLAAYGNIIGRGAYFKVEGSKHYCKFWPILVGESGKARKGTAQDRANELLEHVDSGWFYDRRASGLASGEGLIHHVRDKRTRENKAGEVEVVDEGVVDKRVMITESEFKGPLTIMEKPGNTLSVVLRLAWDDVTLQTLGKHSPEKATGSHITVAAHTNQDELLEHASTSNLGGGIGNRFVFLLVRRSQLLPFGAEKGEFPAKLVNRLQEAVAFGKNAEHIRVSEKKENGQSAADLWRAVYEDLSTSEPGLFGAVTGRAEAQVRRLATIYAALDKSQEVRISHLLAALSLWDYSKQSAYLIFKGRTGDDIADEIYAALQVAGTGGMSMTEISALFNRNVKSGRIRGGLQQLQRDGWAKMEKSQPTGGGRPEERWFGCSPE
jgi:hypothetical protein